MTLRVSATGRRITSAGFCACLLTGILLHAGILGAAEFLEGFDGAETSWQIALGSPACRLVDHRRHAQIRRFGTRSESVIFDSPTVSRVELTHRLSPARILDEPVISTAWIKSNRSGATLSLRVVYPHLIDPETGKIAYRWLDGESYQSDGKWQMLTCKTSPKELVRRNQLLRAQFGAKIELHDAYIDRARLSVELGGGATELFIDELKLSPVVSPSTDTPQLPEEKPAAERYPEFKLQHGRLMLDGQARFPTFMAYHGDPPEELANMGVNLAWIPKADDRQLIDLLGQSGIGVIAAPPLAVSPTGEILDAENAGLAPLGEDLDPILFWMLGNEIPAAGRKRLVSWQKQLMSADRRRRRPLMANVVTDERGFSRVVDMLGVNRTVQGTALDYRRYRGWLTDRQLAARPGSFMWTWIDAEPSADIVARRQQQKLSAPVIEPEQLRLQTYAALAGGMRGLGFWTTQGMFHDGPGAAEMRLMLQQTHFEIRILEPWLATGSPGDEARLQKPGSRGQQTVTRARKPVIAQVGHSVTESPPEASATQPRISATLIESDYGTLLLATWDDDRAQFVPGQMATSEVSFVVPGIKETAKAWEITTTEIRPLDTDRSEVPGGTLIRLKQFDSTAAIVISSDLSLGDDLRRRVRDVQAESATCIVQLARAKLQRVEAVIAELRALGHAEPDADRMLKKTHVYADAGTRELERKDYAAARKNGDYALQMLRILQRAQWDAAVAHLSHPLTTSHTACFQTLPDYWRMMARLRSSAGQVSPNLLHSGDFEDEDTFRTAGWQHSQHAIPGIRATAELVQAPGRRGFSLRLAAGPATDESSPLIIPEAPVTVTTPGISVRAGQSVRIRGSIKVLRPITGTRDGFQLSDSLEGPAAAIHWTQASDWQPFELLRDVQATQTLTLKLTLFGVGEVLIDDLNVQTLESQ